LVPGPWRNSIADNKVSCGRGGGRVPRPRPGQFRGQLAEGQRTLLGQISGLEPASRDHTP
jgi:hypothetical protein